MHPGRQYLAAVIYVLPITIEHLLEFDATLLKPPSFISSLFYPIKRCAELVPLVLYDTWSEHKIRHFENAIGTRVSKIEHLAHISFSIAGIIHGSTGARRETYFHIGFGLLLS